MQTNDQNNTSTARIKLPRKVFEPIYINLKDLEAIREIELAKRRERVLEFQFRG